MKYIIKPFAEIMIKSKPVRKRYLKILQTNLSLALKNIDKTFKVHVFWDKIEINIGQNVNNLLSQFPGIESFLEVEKLLLTLDDYIHKDNNEKLFDYIFELIKDFYIDKIENNIFVVRVKRVGNHTFKSIDLERYLGARFLTSTKNSKVSLVTPNITVNIEIKNNELFIIKDKIIGIGGYPVGTQDKVLSFISGGFDSGVSTFLMMKRGCNVDFLFFNLGGSAHKLGVKQVASYLSKNFSYGYKARFICIPFEDIVGELLLKINSKFRAIILKRLFLFVGSKLASLYGYYALVKGDSLGQVSSQTLKNMSIIDKASDILVLRPLISFNKQEIINITKQIGTYDFACSMPEYCGVVSSNPSTGAKLDSILKEEEKFDFSLLDKAIDLREDYKIDDLFLDQEENLDLDLIYDLSENDIVVDIREEFNTTRTPLKLLTNIVLNIPFYEINHKFKDLDMSKNYLFYCDKGILSKLHALYLKEKGFNNIKIYKNK